MDSQHRNIHGQIVNIECDLGDEVETHDHEVHYAVTGKGTDMIDYQGTAIYIDGEFDEVVDIEEA